MRQSRETYTDVGDEGMEEGEREPTRCVRRCWELRFDSLRSRVGLARLELEMIWRRSVGERLLEIEVSVGCDGRCKSAMRDMVVREEAVANVTSDHFSRVSGYVAYKPT